MRNKKCILVGRVCVPFDVCSQQQINPNEIPRNRTNECIWIWSASCLLACLDQKHTTTGQIQRYQQPSTWIDDLQKHDHDNHFVSFHVCLYVWMSVCLASQMFCFNFSINWWFSFRIMSAIKRELWTHTLCPTSRKIRTENQPDNVFFFSMAKDEDNYRKHISFVHK